MDYSNYAMHDNQLKEFKSFTRYLQEIKLDSSDLPRQNVMETFKMVT